VNELESALIKASRASVELASALTDVAAVYVELGDGVMAARFIESVRIVQQMTAHLAQAAEREANPPLDIAPSTRRN